MTDPRRTDGFLSDPGPAVGPAVERLVVSLAQAISARSLYPAAHSKTRQAVAQACAACERVLEVQGTETTSLLVVGGELVVDRRPLPRGALFQRGLVDQLERRGLEGLTLARGLTVEEMESFLDGMVSPAGPQSTPHLALGRVEVLAGGPLDGAHDGVGFPGGFTDGPTGAGLAAALSAAREAFGDEGVATGAPRRPLDLARLEAVIAPLILALPQGGLVLPDLPPAAGGPWVEALFRHSLRVALLSVALGRALGVDGARLRELGVAALLHDIGKLELPAELLSRPAQGEAERAQLATHTALGAARISRCEGATALASLVAYEHHLRWDGKPTYPPLPTPRQPLLASQVVAVADSYDTARIARPSPPAVSHAAALAFVAGRGGSWLDPRLTATFTRLLTPAGAAAGLPAG